MGTLAEKIAQASLTIGGALSADKKNLQDNYAYISADKLLDRAGEALAKQGIAIVPAITGMQVDTYPTASGKSYFAVTTNMVMTVSDGETTLEFPWVGMGTDYRIADKALYKAMTSGHKYFLMKLLNIGAGNEDGEHESPPEDVKVVTRPTPPARPTNGSNPAAPQGNPFNDDTPAWQTWQSSPDAYAWAVAIGACANEFEAKGSMAKIVAAEGGKNADKARVFEAFYNRQNDKLAMGQ